MEGRVHATDPKVRRILIVDDNRAIHEDIRKSLAGDPAGTSAIDEMEALLFGDTAKEVVPKPAFQFEISSAYQGEEGIELVRRAVREGTPYALAFMDVRMPPGCDGIEALSRIWIEDPALQAVICSAYSDYSWTTLVERLPRIDGFLILKKPFDSLEIRQMAYALTEKWCAHADIHAAYATLRKAEASQRALLDAIPDTILRIKADGTCLEFKTSFAFATQDDKLQQEITRQLMPGVLWAVEEKNIQGVDFDLEVAEGLRHFDAQIASMGGDEVVAIVRDITEIKRALTQEAFGREREAIIRAQAEVLAQMSMPFIPISDRVAVMPLIGDMDGQRVERIRDTLTQRIAEQRASTVIVDLTGIGNLDVTAAEELIRTVQAARLLGAELILTGVRSMVARRMVEIGADFRGVAMRQTLQDGIGWAMRRR